MNSTSNEQHGGNVERFLRLQDVEHRCGIRRSTIYAAMTKGEFPQCVSIGPRIVAWRDTEISAWIAEKIKSSALQKA